jgi:hypothetical protein
LNPRTMLDTGAICKALDALLLGAEVPHLCPFTWILTELHLCPRCEQRLLVAMLETTLTLKDRPDAIKVPLPVPFTDERPEKPFRGELHTCKDVQHWSDAVTRAEYPDPLNRKRATLTYILDVMLSPSKTVSHDTIQLATDPVLSRALAPWDLNSDGANEVEL